ncbi:MAG: DMT family transporter, partial [Mailhella sp.]|nr:DMT family transporter [Mailhella sp.]
MIRFALILPIIAGILWGSVGFFVRILAAEGLDNLTILAARTSMAAALLFVALFVFRRDLLRIRPADLAIFIMSGVIGMLGLNICYNESIVRLTLSFSAVLLSLGPVFVIFFARLFFGEKVTARKIFCVALAILGCVFVSGVLEHLPSGDLSALSIGIGILSAVLYALYSIFSKMALLRGYHAVTILFYSLLAASLVSFWGAEWTSVLNMVDKSPA